VQAQLVLAHVLAQAQAQRVSAHVLAQAQAQLVLAHVLAQAQLVSAHVLVQAQAQPRNLPADRMLLKAWTGAGQPLVLKAREDNPAVLRSPAVAAVPVEVEWAAHVAAAGVVEDDNF